MRQLLKLALIAIFFWLLASIPLAKPFDTGFLEGFITGGRGPIENASIEARNVMSGAMFRTESDVVGHYELNNLRPGRYSLWVEAVGHDSVWIPQIVIERGETTHKDICLDPPRSAPPGI
jgi:hypothetical protein